jgi:hypothetical protein
MGAHFDLSVFCRFSDPYHDVINVKFGGEGTKALKTSIFGSVDNLFQ